MKYRKFLKLALLLLIPLSILLIDYIKTPKENTKQETIEQSNNSEKLEDIDVDYQPPTESIEDENDTSDGSKTTANSTKYELKQTGWIPAWDFDRGYNSLNRHRTDFHSVSPVWYSLKADGSLAADEKGVDKLAKLSGDNDIKIVASIASFSHDDMSSMLNSSANYSRFIGELTEIADAKVIDGIDLDFESTKLTDKTKFLNMVKDVSKILKDRKKIFSFTVIPKWGDNVAYQSLVETRQVQDWQILSQYADEIRIMTYDYTSQKSLVPGPVAPIGWMESVLKYALTKVPKEKLWLGIHLYGYEWVNKKYVPTIDILSLDLSEQVQSNSYTYSTIKEILSASYTDTIYNSDFEEGIATYNCLSDSFCTLFYPNKQSVKARIELAKKYQIAGVAYWKLGGDSDILD